MSQRWTRKWLEEIREEELRTEVLTPLFHAMGYTEVRDFHGPNERGKDLVLKKKTEFGESEYTAVVVKAVAVTGSAGGSLNEVHTQVTQALNSSIRTTADGERRSINRALVVTSQHMKEDAVDRFHELMKHFRGQVTLLHGDKLWEFVARYLPQALIFDRLNEAQRHLGEADPSHRFAVAVQDDITHIVAMPQGEATDNVQVSVSETDGEQAEEARRLLREHEETGRPVELDLSVVNVEGMPDVMQRLLQGNRGGFVRLGARPGSGRPFPVSFGVRDESGDEHTGLPYVELYVEHAGTRQITFSNAHQSIGILVQLRVHTEEKRITITYTPKEAGVNVAEYLKIANFLTSKGKGIIRAYDSGAEIAWTPFPSPVFVEGFSEKFREWLGLVVEVQNATKTNIQVPEREFFTEADVECLAAALNIIRTGQFFATSVNAVKSVGEIRTMLKKSPVIKPFRYTDNVRIPILDTVVDFGDCRPAQRVARIAPEVWRQLPGAIEDRQDDERFLVPLVPRYGKRFRCVVPGWKTKKS